MNSLFKIIVSITSKIFTAEVPKSLAQKKPLTYISINLRSNEQENKQTTKKTKTKKKPNKLYKR